MAQKFERIVQEDLNVGTGAVWVTAPGGGQLRSTQVGLHSVARGQVAYDAAWTPGAIAAGSNASTTVTVPDATTGDFVMASHDKMLTNGLRISGHISADDTAKVVIHNPTAASITVAAGTVSVLVFPSIGTAIPTSMVFGYVFEFDGTTPRVGATVSMTVDGVAWSGGDATTSGTGLYQFTEVPAGAIVVSCVGEENSGTTVPPTPLQLNIILPPS